jgi:sugar phosphate isomerase/epimerase
MRLSAVIPTDSAASRQTQIEAGAAFLASIGLTGAMFGYVEALQAAPIRAAYARAGVTIAEICLPNNLCTDDLDERERIAERVVTAMQFADEVGCAVTVACSGGYNPRFWIGADARNFGEQGYQAIVAVCRSIAERAERRGVRAVLCIEPVIVNVICSVERLARLVDEVHSPHIQAHMDAANLMSLDNIYDNGRHIAAWFAALGGRIRSVHAKDSILEDRLTLHIDERMPGQGQLDFAAYLHAVDRLPAETPFVVEHLATGAEIAQAVGYIRTLAQREGVTLR